MEIGYGISAGKRLKIGGWIKMHFIRMLPSLSRLADLLYKTSYQIIYTYASLWYKLSISDENF